MSQQTTLDNYFKSKANAVPTLLVSAMDKPIKRRSLSLTKPQIPSKSPKAAKQINVSNKQEDLIITLSSDSEPDGNTTPSKCAIPVQDNSGNTDNSAPETIIYNLSPSLFPQTQNVSPSSKNQVTGVPRISVRKDLTQQFSGGSEVKTPNEIEGSPKTPSRTPKSKNKRDGFFSPTKKRVVGRRRTPIKRNLAQQFSNDASPTKVETDEFSKACKGMDDKTIFLLSIIDKCLSNDALRGLLGDSSQMLLNSCLHAVKPGMRLVCRLYWRQIGWYRRDQLTLMCAEDAEEKKALKANGIIDSPGMQAVLNDLVKSGLIISTAVEGEGHLDFDDYAKLLKKPELQQICKNFKLNVQSKQDAVIALKNYSQRSSIAKYFNLNSLVENNSRRVLEMLKHKAGECYKLSELARSTLDRLYVLMYLGADYSLIREKRLELMLINNKINRETFPIDKNMSIDNASIVFSNKDEFDRYFYAHCMYEDYLASTDASKKKEIVTEAYEKYTHVGDQEMLRYKSLPPWLRRFTPCNIFVKLLESGVQELKKDKTQSSYELAVDILRKLQAQIAFRQHKKAEWYAEMALILHSYLNRSKEAAEVLIEGFKSNMTDEIKDYMRPRASKIADQQKIELGEELRDILHQLATKESLLEKNHAALHVYKQPMDNTNQRGKQRFETRTEDGRSVLSAEQFCIEYLIKEGLFTHGEHWEGRIVTTLFFLLFWDIIYTKPVGVTGLFLSHYQRYPLDMFSESFYINRKTLIDDRLILIEECTDDMVMEMLQNKWEERPESELSDVQRSIGWSNVLDVSKCLGARGLAAVCARLAKNYGYACSGFPDLTMWNIHTKKIKFIEVKTDSDKPSMKQLQWMGYLRDNEIDVAFCYLGAHIARRRARPNIELLFDT